jgi:hypothetical protein
MFNKLPLRATNVIREYSTQSTRSDWINSETFLTNSKYDEIEKLNINTFIVTILIIVFNIIICINILYIMAVVIGTIVCMYKSQV